MPPTAADGALMRGRWQARLALGFETRGGATRLVANRHEGPIRLLKALASEDGQVLEAVVVHPPGGLAGGDWLSIDVDAGPGTRVLMTTPGAQKWYRALRGATATTRLAIGAGAFLEWLPQPSILFDGARAEQRLTIELAADATCVGWEQLVRGRVAMGERLREGHVTQSITLSVAGRDLWQERLAADADDRLFASPLGWNGRRVAASIWCCAPAAPRLADLRDRWRSEVNTGDVQGGATLVAPGLVVARLLADDSEAAQLVAERLWRTARISLGGVAGTPPRIWRT